VYDNAYQNQFLFGGSMMVVPVTSTERNKKLYLPKGEWYNIYSDERLTGEAAHLEEVPIYQLPVFIKGSSIIPLQGIVQSTKENPSDTLQLHIYNGSEKNSFMYYEDEGDGFGYKSNIYCKKQMIFSPADKKMVIEKQQGSFTSKFKKLRLVFHGFGGNMKTIKVNGTAIAVFVTNEAALLDGLANLAGIYDAGYYAMLKNNSVKMTQQGVVINNTSDELSVEW
jgi:alpha-glucosidase